MLIELIAQTCTRGIFCLTISQLFAILAALRKMTICKQGRKIEMRFARFIIFMLVAILVATACMPVRVPQGDKASSNAAGTPTVSTFGLYQTPTPLPRTRVLRINLPARPDLLDPQRAASNNDVAILQLAYEGLTRVDQNGKVIPGAAEKWEFSSDGKTLTFRLRAGLKRADGTPMVAKDFEYAFKRAVDPRLAARAQSFLDDVRGAITAYSLDPKSKPDDIDRMLNNVAVKATDDLTLVVTFEQPTGYFPVIASTWVGWSPDKTRVDKDVNAWWLKAENQNGNGPFKISDIQDEVIKLVANPNYWGGAPKIDRIEFYWLPDAAVFDSYRKNEIDIVRVTSDNILTIQADAQLAKDLVRAPAARVTYLGFNVKKAPFTDKNVRKAFSQALDRDGFVRDVLRGLGKPYTSWIPPGTPGYDATATVPSYNEPEAVKTLIDAGYGTADKKKVDCNKLGTIKLTYSNTPRTQLLFQFLAGSLTKVFACPVLVDPVEPSAYPVVIRDPKTTPQVYLIPWEEEYAHPQNWLFLHACNGVYAQRIGYCNRDFDVALAFANQELDAEKAVAKYQAAQKIFVGDVPGAFLWNNENAFLVKPYVLKLWDGHGTADYAFPGQYGPVSTYDIDIMRVPENYPKQ